MHHQAQNIRAFIGSKNYQESILFYQKWGFQHVEIGEKMSLFRVNDNLSFYLQDYYVKDWVDNSMLFLEVADLNQYTSDLNALALDKQFEKVRLSEIQPFEWGHALYLHDPSGVLWHICEFSK